MKKLYKVSELPRVVAIVGSRTFTDSFRIINLVKKFPKGTIVVSGGALEGVDKFVVDAVNLRHKDIHYKEFPVEDYEWDAFHKAAGPLRNKDLVHYVKIRGGVVLVYTTKEMTPGSQSVIDACKEMRVNYLHLTEGVPYGED